MRKALCFIFTSGSFFVVAAAVVVIFIYMSKRFDESVPLYVSHHF